MRRIPPGQISKAYRKLYDVWRRYTNRWVTEKGYVDATHFNDKLSALLHELQRSLEGGEVSSPTIPAPRYAQRPQEEYIQAPQEEEFEEPEFAPPAPSYPAYRRSTVTQGVPVSLRRSPTHTRFKSRLKPLIPSPKRRIKRRSVR